MGPIAGSVVRSKPRPKVKTNLSKSNVIENCHGRDPHELVNKESEKITASPKNKSKNIERIEKEINITKI